MEITDITEEFQAQREDYLDSIRDQSKECKLLQQLLDQVTGSLAFKHVDLSNQSL